MTKKGIVLLYLFFVHRPYRTRKKRTYRTCILSISIQNVYIYINRRAIRWTVLFFFSFSSLTMIAISTIFALFVFSTCHGRMLFFEQCANDTIDFATKVENSSFVVFGMSKQKTLADGSDSMFHVNFQVDCIFKGPAMPKMINITQAGRKRPFQCNHQREMFFLRLRERKKILSRFSYCSWLCHSFSRTKSIRYQCHQRLHSS